MRAFLLAFGYGLTTAIVWAIVDRLDGVPKPTLPLRYFDAFLCSALGYLMGAFTFRRNA